MVRLLRMCMRTYRSCLRQLYRSICLSLTSTTHACAHTSMHHMFVAACPLLVFAVACPVLAVVARALLRLPQEAGQALLPKGGPQV